MLCEVTSSSHAEQVAALRSAGLRVTGPRLAVLSVVTEGKHMTAEQVALAVRELGAVSTQGVYDVLGACSDAGIVRRIEPAGRPARYELRVGDNHHHVVCRRCGAVERRRLRGRRGAVPRPVRRRSASTSTRRRSSFWGSCPDCQGRPRPTNQEEKDDA